MPVFAKVSVPLRVLTKKNATFLWMAKCETTFVELKCLLTTVPVLVYPRFSLDRSFVLETDANGIELGAVLSQVQEDGARLMLLTGTLVFRTYSSHIMPPTKESLFFLLRPSCSHINYIDLSEKYMCS